MMLFSEGIRTFFVIVLGLALIAIFLRRKSAAIRNQACRVLMVAALLAPIAGSGLALLAQFPVATVSPEAVRTAPAWIPQSALPEQAYVLREPSRAHRQASFEKELFSVEILGAIYILGAAMAYFGLARGMYRLSRIMRNAVRLEPFEGIAVYRAMDGELRVPITCGSAYRAKIVLPAGAADWPESRIEASLRHEAAHVRRNDAFWMFSAQLFCMLNWYNPAAYLLGKMLRATAEEAADDAVLAQGTRPSEYAQELLAVAKEVGSFRTTAAAMVGRKGVERRIRAILAENRDRRRATLVFGATAAMLLGGLTLAIGSLTTRMKSYSLVTPKGVVVVKAGDTAVLGDGTRIEIDSVQDFSIDRVATWSPAGYSVPPPAGGPPSGYRKNSAKPLHELGFNASIEDPLPDSDVFFKVSFTPSLVWTTNRVEGIPDRFLARMFALKGNIDGFATDVGVGVASGPWLSYDRPLQPIEPYRRPDTDSLIVRFDLPSIPTEGEWRITAISSTGRTLQTGKSSGFLGPEVPKRQSTFVTVPSGERLDHFELSYRTYRWAVFKDVVLQPGQATLEAARRPRIRASFDAKGRQSDYFMIDIPEGAK